MMASVNNPLVQEKALSAADTTLAFDLVELLTGCRRPGFVRAAGRAPLARGATRCNTSSTGQPMKPISGSCSGSIIQESPLLAAIAGTVLALALVILLARGGRLPVSVDRRRRASSRARAPPFGGAAEDWTGVSPRPSGPPRTTAEPPIGARRVRVWGRMAAFLIGLVGGAAGIVISSQGTSHSRGHARRTDRPCAEPRSGSADGGGETTAAGIAPAAAVSAPPAGHHRQVRTSHGRGRREGQARHLRRRVETNLPRAAGPELSLTRVDNRRHEAQPWIRGGEG